MTHLILMCGLPGAGKTTTARELADTLPAVRLSPDEWLTALGMSIFDGPGRERTEQKLWQHAQELLRLGQTVILENGFWAAAERDHYRDTARTLHARVSLVFLDAPPRILKDRVRHRLDPALIDEYDTIFEAPTEAELGTYDPLPSPAGGG